MLFSCTTRRLACALQCSSRGPDLAPRNTRPQSSTVSSGFGSSPKYVLPMFPYPSGELHLGHVRVYTISDVVGRYYRANGKQVIHPMGWDSFGLPAENAAIERGLDPEGWTKRNIDAMRKTLMRLGCSFDWDREVATSHPSYYKWTQWLFLRLYEHGFVYRKNSAVNWDPVDHTVLANEQVDGHGRSWRSGALVEQKMLDQWYFRTTAFAEELLEGLSGLDWPESLKEMQRNWILDRSGKLLLRDWLVSRQRYWGTPIPMVHCDRCGTVPVPEDDLPVPLPPLASRAATSRSLSLAQFGEWRKTSCPRCGNDRAKRDADTMDTFVDSAWYYLRFLQPRNEGAPFPCRDQTIPVDIYVGGVEHAVLHLLYARFVARFLHKIGSISFQEPFQRIITQGMVEAQTYIHPETGRYYRPSEVERNGEAIVCRVSKEKLLERYEKMSKSKYNGVSPEDLLQKYGGDALRLGILLTTKPEDNLQWDPGHGSVRGAKRFLKKVEALASSCAKYECTEEHLSSKTKMMINDTVTHVNEVMTRTFAFNTAGSKLNKFLISIQELKSPIEQRGALQYLLSMLQPFSPELCARIARKYQYSIEAWPRLLESLDDSEQRGRGVVLFNNKFEKLLQIRKTDKDFDWLGEELHKDGMVTSRITLGPWEDTKTSRLIHVKGYRIKHWKRKKEKLLESKGDKESGETTNSKPRAESSGSKEESKVSRLSETTSNH